MQRSVRHEPAFLGKLPRGIHARQVLLERHLDNPLRVKRNQRTQDHQKRVRLAPCAYPQTPFQYLGVSEPRRNEAVKKELAQLELVSLKTGAAILSAGFHNVAKRVIFGNVSLRISTRLPLRSAKRTLSPVTFPPGLAKLSASPEVIGSPVVTTIGRVFVAC